MVIVMVIDCTACQGVGCYAGNGEICRTCLGWGYLKVKKVAPCDGVGNVKTVDIETEYRNRKPQTFEEWDRLQVQQRAWNRLTAMSLLTPDWTDD